MKLIPRRILNISRRFRRQSRQRSQTLLPLHSSRLSNAISSWYFELRTTRFNESLFNFGQKYSRFLRLWFAVGVGFTLCLLFGAIMILLWEVVVTLCLTNESDTISDLFNFLFFGSHPSSFGLKTALIDAIFLVVSTVISVVVHEFGHAAAAASEGIKLEYIAIFLAITFPGALVAFDYEELQAKPRSVALRIYCAGIWHNAVFCAACGLALLLLPFVLSPFYVYGNGPMVLGFSGRSPVSGYLSPGDVIVSMDGVKIHTAQDWLEMATYLEKRMLLSSESEVIKGSLTINGRTYCVPSSLVAKSEDVPLMSNHSACPVEHFAFVSVPCFDSKVHFSSIELYDTQGFTHNGYCLNSADMVRIKSCGSLWSTSDENSCICSVNELCMSPVQKPGVVWVEIMYRSPYSHQCLKLEQNLTDVENSDFGGGCNNTFLYAGDVISMARSVKMTSFQPRFASPFGAYLADMLEKIFVCTFQVSLALALTNSIPVYFLDGESILELISFNVTVLSPGWRKLLLQVILFGGSIISCLVFLRIVLAKIW